MGVIVMRGSIATRTANVQDKPHVHHHHHVHYEPEGGEQCWIKNVICKGIYPSGNDCGACSFVGTVCMDL